jgi:phage baseplate assembly protein W
MAAGESAISLPFSIDLYGNVSKTTDQTKIWMDRVLSVIGTMHRERVMKPTFGTKIAMNVLDNADIAMESIKREIYNAFTAYLQPLKLDELDVSFDEDSATVTATITYSLPNQTKVTTAIGVATISGTKILSEELL